ncbi:O-antigen ligase family protein [Candidatus Sumerlaeota bacterium]|nr:O-antigen ligase family protein [Candidatus Sumerlaeota bacterium]
MTSNMSSVVRSLLFALGFVRPLTPLGTFYALALILLGIVLGLGHMHPAAAYPESGLPTAIGLLGVCLLAIVVAGIGGPNLGGLARPALAFTLFVVWAWGRTAFSSVPTDGAPEVSMFVEGLALFWLGAFAVRGGRWFDAASAGGQADSEPGGAQPGARATQDASRETSTPLAEDSKAGERVIAIFFSLLALCMSVHAILQYHYLFADTLETLRRLGALDPSDPLSEGIAYALQIRRPGSWFGNANVLCGFLAMCVPFAASVGEGATGRGGAFVRVARVAILCAMAYAAWLTGSRGGGIVFVLALVLAGAGIALRARGVVMLGALAGVLSLGPLSASCPARAQAQEAVSLDRTRSASEDEEPPARRTIVQRVYYVRSGLAMWKSAVLSGHGLGAYARLYPSTRIRGAQETRYAHNFVIQIGVETGLIGVALLGWFIFELARAARRLFVSRRASPCQWAVGAGAFLFLIDSLGEYTFYFQEVFKDFALLCGAFCAAAAGPRVEGVESPTEKKAWRTRVLPLVSVVLFGAALWRVTVPELMARRCSQELDAVWDEMRRVLAQEPVAEGPGRFLFHLRQDALRFADEGVSWQPRNPVLWRRQAGAYASVGRIDEACASLRRAIALNPLSASSHASLARLEWDAGHRDEAVRLIDRAVALHPFEPDHRVERARILAGVGRRPEALAEAREARRLSMSAREYAAADAVLRELGAGEEESRR